MRKVLVGLVGSLGITLALVPDARACGDKFLVIGRGVRAQRAYGAVHKASILLYLDPHGELPAVIKETNLEADLKRAGHSLRTVGDRREVDAALGSGSFDLVLADIGDMTSLEPEVRVAPSKPVLLPIIYNPTGEELAAAQKQYRCVMRSPSTKQHFLAVIDDALVFREKEREAAKRR